VVGVLNLVVVCLLDVLHLVINKGLGEVAALSLKGAIDHTFPFLVLVFLQRDVRGFPVVVIVLIGMIGWILLTHC
jgi:hypothetical protein